MPRSYSTYYALEAFFHVPSQFLNHSSMSLPFVTIPVAHFSKLSSPRKYVCRFEGARRTCLRESLLSFVVCGGTNWAWFWIGCGREGLG
jgi:hypothetical protein